MAKTLQIKLFFRFFSYELEELFGQPLGPIPRVPE